MKKRALEQSVDTDTGKSVGDLIGSFLWMLTVADREQKNSFCQYFRQHMPHLAEKRRQLDMKYCRKKINEEKIREIVNMIADLDQFVDEEPCVKK